MDISELGAAVKDERVRRGLSLQDAADEIGITKSTLYRFEETRRADTDNLIRLAGWLGRPLSPGTVSVRVDDTLGAIADVINSDPSLTASAKFALIELMGVAYRAHQY